MQARPAPDRTRRRQLLLERDGGTCAWCGRAFGPLVQPTTEHVVPRVKGGPSWLENELLACRRCNGRRRARPYPERELRRLPRRSG